MNDTKMDAAKDDVTKAHQEEHNEESNLLQHHVEKQEDSSETQSTGRVIKSLQKSETQGTALPHCNKESFIFCLDDSIYDCKNQSNTSRNKPLKLKVYSMSRGGDNDVLMVMKGYSGVVPMHSTLSESSSTVPDGKNAKQHQPSSSDTSPASCKNDGQLKMPKSRHMCPFCGRCFTRKLSVKRHVENVHSTDQKQYKCQVCDRVYKDYSNYKQHVNGKHKGIFKYTCEDCGKGYNRLMQYKVHLSTHTGKMLFKCEICSEEFLWKHYLTVHMRKHRGEFPFQCDQCEKKFHSSSRLINHKRTHVEFKELVKKKQCVFCDKKFETKRDLDNHERVHTGARTFPCTLCDKGYASKSALKEHVKTHGERDIACPVCEKTFHKTFVLKEHMKIHTQEMPFMCQFCAKRYRWV